MKQLNLLSHGLTIYILLNENAVLGNIILMVFMLHLFNSVKPCYCACLKHIMVNSQ